jgi:hypothetical protein
MLERELKELCKYLKKNLAKGFIRELQLLARFPVLFVLKKDSELQPCINYWKLNKITIKSWYLLLNINKLQDWLARAMYFTALDIRGAYNLICMKEGEE